MNILIAAGGRPLVVGGYVRDALLGLQPKDADIEVFGLSIEQIQKAFNDVGKRVDIVGQSFGVLKIDNKFDVSVPRRENAVGVGHKDFEITVDPNMTIEEAASRRDFTINSMACDVLGNLHDPHNGLRDLESGTLRATSHHFSEDALRVLRGMQFASRFDMVIDEATRRMCQDMKDGFQYLPKERLWGEWEKWALKGKRPGVGLNQLYMTGWMALFPEIQAMWDVPQDPEWHPEGSVGAHTSCVCDAALKIADRENLSDEDRVILIFSALCHDMGKATTTIKNDVGRWIAPNHAQAGEPIARIFMESIGAPTKIIEAVCVLTAQHMRHISSLKADQEVTEKMVRRLANDMKAHSTIRMWAFVVESDHSGRPPFPPSSPVLDWVAMAESLAIKDSAPKPIVMGRHLLESGMMKAGKEMGILLAQLFERQLDGEFSSLDDGLELAKSLLERPINDSSGVGTSTSTVAISN